MVKIVEDTQPTPTPPPIQIEEFLSSFIFHKSNTIENIPSARNPVGTVSFETITRASDNPGYCLFADIFT